MERRGVPPEEREVSPQRDLRTQLDHEESLVGVAEEQPPPPKDLSLGNQSQTPRWSNLLLRK